MDVPRKTIEKLSGDQELLLAQFRTKRNFNANKYIKLKSLLIDRYIKNNNLNTVVVGISGGIDSAIVLALLIEAQKLGNLKNIIPVCLPAVHSNGVSNQKDVIEKAFNLCRHFGLQLLCQDISLTVEEIEKHFNNDKSPWASGQLVSVLRVSYFNYIATISTQQNNRAIIAGTANRSEIYLGYTGKYSDLMVDIQIITDLFKSEVFQVAKKLNIPQSILDATPRGDVFDASSDETVFGATYDAVELYTYSKFSGQAANNIEALRKYNKHKFKVGSPAVHLDLYESGFSDVWNLQFEDKYWDKLDKQGDIVKPQFVAPMTFAQIKFDETPNITVTEEDGVLCFHNVFSEKEIQELKQLYYSANKKEANVFGYTNTKTKQIGSSRATLYNVELAKTIWKRIRPFLDTLILAKNPTTDWKEGEIYRMVGVSPLHRYISYNQNGASLVAHYDYSFVEERYKTLFSLVIGLTDNETGPTNFLFDDQADSWEKDLSDKQPEYNQQIKKSYLTKAGSVLCFGHHLLHSGGEVNNEEKIIIRTDIVCEKINYA